MAVCFGLSYWDMSMWMVWFCMDYVCVFIRMSSVQFLIRAPVKNFASKIEKCVIFFNFKYPHLVKHFSLALKLKFYSPFFDFVNSIASVTMYFHFALICVTELETLCTAFFGQDCSFFGKFWFWSIILICFKSNQTMWHHVLFKCDFLV